MLSVCDKTCSPSLNFAELCIPGIVVKCIRLVSAKKNLSPFWLVILLFCSGINGNLPLLPKGLSAYSQPGSCPRTVML